MDKDVVWGFCANTYGPWWVKPKRFKKQHNLAGWWDASGDYCVEFIGVDLSQDGVIKFASYDKNETRRFIDGFMACRHLLSVFFKG